MCEHGNVIVLDVPDHLKSNVRATICVDSCIANAIKMLWENGIETEGCCCGHGRIAGGCELIVPSKADPSNMAKAQRLLTENDDRYWTILEWKLVHVASVYHHEATKDVRERRSQTEKKKECFSY